MTELIEAIIEQAITEGELPDETPGLLLARNGSGLEIRIDEERYRLQYERVKEFFQALGAISAAPVNWSVGSPMQSLKLKKVGTGAVIEITRRNVPTARFTMTQSIARNLRRQLSNLYPVPWELTGR
jgi:hypothetical protein